MVVTFYSLWMTGRSLWTHFSVCMSTASFSNFAKTRGLSSIGKSQTVSQNTRLIVMECWWTLFGRGSSHQDSWIIRFQEETRKFLPLPTLPAKLWQQLFGHMVLLECFVQPSKLRMHLFQWQLVMCSGQKGGAGFLFEEMQGEHQIVDGGGQFTLRNPSSAVPSISSLYRPFS